MGLCRGRSKSVMMWRWGGNWGYIMRTDVTTSKIGHRRLESNFCIYAYNVIIRKANNTFDLNVSDLTNSHHVSSI